MTWIYAFSQSLYDWQRRLLALLQPRDACRFTACCPSISKQKTYIAELHRAENPHWCAICGNVLCHPYRLPDCGHVACGKCIYDKTYRIPSDTEFHGWRCQHPADDWKQSCDTAVRKRPEKLGAGYCSQEAHDAAAAAAMPTAEMREQWKAWHDGRVHPGLKGHFGGDWSVFESRGFPADFDEDPHANYRDLAGILPGHTTYTLTICPAAHNFSPFPAGAEREFDREDATRVVTDVVLEEGVCVDDVLLVTEARGWLDDNGYENQNVIEYVVQGWEELLALSEDDGAGSEESDPDSYTESSEE